MKLTVFWNENNTSHQIKKFFIKSPEKTCLDTGWPKKHSRNAISAGYRFEQKYIFPQCQWVLNRNEFGICLAQLHNQFDFQSSPKEYGFSKIIRFWIDLSRKFNIVSNQNRWEILFFTQTDLKILSNLISPKSIPQTFSINCVNFGYIISASNTLHIFKQIAATCPECNKQCNFLLRRISTAP